MHATHRIGDVKTGSCGSRVTLSSSWRSGVSATTRCRRCTDATRPLARVVYLPGGDGFLLQSNLRALPPDRTYQLWALMGGSSPERPISAGVLGPDPGITAFRVHGPVVGFAITDEQSPGVVSPGSNPPLIQGAVS